MKSEASDYDEKENHITVFSIIIFSVYNKIY